MSEKNVTATEKNVQNAASVQSAPAAKQQVAPAAQQAQAAKTGGPVVYCGPSVKRLVSQYRVFSAGLPSYMNEFVAAHPAVRGLIVPISKFAETRRDLENPKSAAAILYKAVRDELKNEK